MSRRSISTLVLSMAVALLTGTSLASTASATPVWKFNNVTLVGSETILDHDVESAFTIPGLTTTCKPFVYAMTISNSAGTGIGSITEVPLSNCFTDSKACTVEAIAAEGLPWAAKLAMISSKNYLAISGFEVSILYGGASCALNEIEVVIDGSVGGLVDNATESTTFSASSSLATKLALLALGQAVEWNGAFTMIATGSHLGQSLTVG